MRPVLVCLLLQDEKGSTAHTLKHSVVFCMTQDERIQVTNTDGPMRRNMQLPTARQMALKCPHAHNCLSVISAHISITCDVNLRPPIESTLWTQHRHMTERQDCWIISRSKCPMMNISNVLNAGLAAASRREREHATYTQALCCCLHDSR